MRHPVGSNIVNQRRKSAAFADMQTSQHAVAEPGKSWRKREETWFVKMSCYGFNCAIQCFLYYRQTVNISQLLWFSLLTSFCNLFRKWNKKRKEKRQIVKILKKLFFLSALYTPFFFSLSLFLVFDICSLPWNNVYVLFFSPLNNLT